MEVDIKMVLKIKDLNKNFGQTQVLKKINFKVHQGDFICIMGQSGSGKSTLLHTISGMDCPTSGQVFFNDQELGKLDDEAMSKVRLEQMGFIFQHSYLLKNLSIRDNILLPGFKAGLVSRSQVNKNATKLMDKMGITDVAHHDIAKVSGGQLQRAAICRALINNPRILFGDEPTGALNSGAGLEVMGILNKINGEGTTVILVSHDLKIAARSSRVIYILDGKIHDELSLGRYEGNRGNLLNRERALSKFLTNKGF